MKMFSSFSRGLRTSVSAAPISPARLSRRPATKAVGKASKASALVLKSRPELQVKTPKFILESTTIKGLGTRNMVDCSSTEDVDNTSFMANEEEQNNQRQKQDNQDAELCLSILKKKRVKDH